MTICETPEQFKREFEYRLLAYKKTLKVWAKEVGVETDLGYVVRVKDLLDFIYPSKGETK